jgi:hypothetical protein
MMLPFTFFFHISIFEPIPRRIALLLLPLTDCARVPARLGRSILFAVQEDL